MNASYRLKMSYSRWPGAPKYQATVFLSGWGLLYLAQRHTAKEAYAAAQRAIRAYHRYGDVNYCGK